jgi:hypothetical protein
MDKNTFALNLTSAELGFVVSGIGASLLLLENPFAGQSTEQAEIAMRRAQELLATRRYIQVQPDGRVAMDTAVAALVGALAFAQTSLAATRVAGSEAQPTIRRIYSVTGLIVEQEQQHDQTHRLTAVRDREVMTRRLTKYLHLADQPAPLAQSCKLPALAVSEAHRIALVEGEHACAGFLESEGAPADATSYLAQAMAYPVCQSSLLALAWKGREAERLGGFTLLEGQQGLWLLRPLSGDSESRLEAVPCDATYASRQVEELAHLVVPSMQE